MNELTAQTYLNAFQCLGEHGKIKGGTIHDFLKESKVVYYGGKCPVYYIEHYYNGFRCVIGGNYASNGKPRLRMFEQLDFVNSPDTII